MKEKDSELDAVFLQPSTFHSTNIHILEEALKRNAPSHKSKIFRSCRNVFIKQLFYLYCWKNLFAGRFSLCGLNQSGLELSISSPWAISGQDNISISIKNIYSNINISRSCSTPGQSLTLARRTKQSNGWNVCKQNVSL